MYSVDQLEDAVVAAVQVAGYDARPMNRNPTLDEISAETSEKPAVLVVFDRTEPATTNFTTLEGADFHFLLVVTARNLRGGSSAERGEGSSPGIYTMLEGLRAALAGNSLGLTVQPMTWISEKPLSRQQRQSTYTQEWKLTVYE